MGCLRWGLPQRGAVVVTVIYTKRATTCAISKWGMTTQDVYELVLNPWYKVRERAPYAWGS